MFEVDTDTALAGLDRSELEKRCLRDAAETKVLDLDRDIERLHEQLEGAIAHQRKIEHDITIKTVRRDLLRAYIERNQGTIAPNKDTYVSPTEFKVRE